ncbi:MAG: tRNA lysidine(34) synthetase TilS [Sutterellaceae bacterium]|nr:tRNA lysidine(34) synthetase TilS [Sutterellaceae bacterium]
MAESDKKPRVKKASRGLASLREHLTMLVRTTIETISDRRAAHPMQDFTLEPVNPVRVIVAYSGGRDSTALLDVLARLKKDSAFTRLASVTVVHVHHGLSKHADEWVDHARLTCAKYRLPLLVEKVYVNPNSALGVEAAAREARYRVLLKIAREHRADVIMTAHHLDDRIETFLIQWMRGAGVEGLSAMTPVRPMESVTEADTQVVLARPWLDVTSHDILTYATKAKLSWIEDDSNTDTRFLRNLIRNDVLPILDEARDGWRMAAARSIGLVSESAQVVRSVATDDLKHCLGPQPASLNIAKLLALPLERQSLCLRAWLSGAKLKAPSQVKTLEILRQLRDTQNDTKLSFRLEGKELRRWAGCLVLRDPVPTTKATDALVKVLDWKGEEELSLGIWGGVLRFEPCQEGEDGFDARKLKDGVLEVRPRKGGEKIKLHRLRPSRNLKQLFQSAGVPSFDRSRLPLVWLDGELIFAAGLGMEVRSFADKDLVKDRIRLVWVPDKPLLAL